MKHPDLHVIAEYLSKSFLCEKVVIIGSENFETINEMFKSFDFIGIQIKSSTNSTIKTNDRWISDDFKPNTPIPISVDILKKSLIIYIMQETDNNSPFILEKMRYMMNFASVGLITSFLKDEHPILSREAKEFKHFLKRFHLNSEFIGYVNFNNQVQIISILGNNNLLKVKPTNFKVIAIMTVYNEGDIIFDSITKLIREQIHVYVIDNWSTDSTLNTIQQFNDQEYFLGYERFPVDGNHENFQFLKLLQRKEDLTQQLEADWFIHADADEIRLSPWNELNLYEAIYYVDQMGFNAIDHTMINFRPIDSSFTSGDFEVSLRYFEFAKGPGDLMKINAWKNTGEKVNLQDHAGHSVLFKDRKVCPFNFLIKHYPLRSPNHARKKIFLERKPRYMPELKANGWHVHYDHTQEHESFIWNPQDLIQYKDFSDFSDQFLYQMIARINI